MPRRLPETVWTAALHECGICFLITAFKSSKFKSRIVNELSALVRDVSVFIQYDNNDAFRQLLQEAR